MFAKVLLVVVALVAVASAARTDREYRSLFQKFVKEHGKSYAQAEFLTKFNVFKTNVDFIDTWNTKGFHTVAINQFADLTAAEFGKIYNGLRVNVNTSDVEYVSTIEAPASVNWVTKGAVTPIKNQQQCGSCWSFSTTGSVEGAHWLNTSTLVSLSEQNLVDCSTAQGNQGCDGGLMTQAMDYIKIAGIDTEASYPYTAQDGNCHFSTSNVGSHLKSYTNVAQGSESGLQDAVVLGPVSVAIDASHNSFQLYSSGVYYEPSCSATQLDHGVLAVGYDTTSSGTAYWIVKNSWGTSWGQAGYIWMSRNRNNNCGIATMATRPSPTGAF